MKRPKRLDKSSYLDPVDAKLVQFRSSGFRWRVHHFALYLVSAFDGTYWVFHVPLSDGGGSLIDLDFWMLPEDQISESGRYTREQVVKIARLAGHSMEQIEAALLLADTGDAAAHHDLASMGDEEYETRIRNAKRRLRNWQRRVTANFNNAVNPSL